MSDTPVIAFEGVWFSYGAASVLQEVNLSTVEGDLVCMVGPNGGGKTTLLKLMLGLLTPDRGQVLVFGQAPKRARRRVGYMPQHAHLDPQFPVSVMDVVLMGRLGSGPTLGPYRRSDKAIASRALHDVGLAELQNRPLSALSGGQRQRVLLARALACEPELLLLDEPTASVDVAAQDDLYQLLEELNRRMTLVVVTHDVGVVSQMFKSVICVNRTVQVHPTASLSGEIITDLYQHEVRMVRHDHDHLPAAEKEHG